MENSKNVQILILVNGLVIVSEIDEVYSELGGPDCKLTNPFLIESEELVPWLTKYTNQKEVMMSSDKILTILEPTGTFFDKYLELTQ